MLFRSFEYAHQDGTYIGDLLFTVDQKTADDTNSPDVSRLTCWWRDIIRDYEMINIGKAPAYPENHPPQCLTELYDRLVKMYGDHPGIKSDDLFSAVRDDMVTNDPPLLAELQSLSRTVPPDFQAVPDPFVDPKLKDEGGPAPNPNYDSEAK